jgi:hypothetical protein
MTDKNRHSAGAFDIRNVIAALLGIYGIVLLLCAAFLDPGAETPTQGQGSRSSSASAQGSRRTTPGLTDGARFALRNAEDQEPTEGLPNDADTVTQNDSINDKRSLRVAHGWNIRQYAAF